MNTEEVLRRALREACAVTGEIAGALSRRRIRSGDLERWEERLREAAEALRSGKTTGLSK